MLIEKIKEYVNQHSINKLSQVTGVNSEVIFALYSWDEKRKYVPKKLEVLYNFFNIKKDIFFSENIKRWNPPTKSIVWSYIRYKRLEKWKSIEDIAKWIRVDVVTIRRFELGIQIPSPNSYLLKNIMNFLEFSDEEKVTVEQFINTFLITRKKINKWKNDIDNRRKK